MKPPARKRIRAEVKKTLEDSLVPANAVWTLEEKTQLLEALKIYGPDDPNKLRRNVPTKTVGEIKMFIGRAQRRTIRSVSVVKTKAPIEVWLDMAQNLVEGSKDHSCALTQVLSMAGRLEPPKQVFSATEPNYKAIYNYLSALITGKHSSQNLAPVDCLVLVEILRSLAEHLSQLDDTVQKEMMEEKFQLINKRVKIENREESKAAILKALNNELSCIAGDTTSSTANLSERDTEDNSVPSTSCATEENLNSNSNSKNPSKRKRSSLDDDGIRKKKSTIDAEIAQIKLEPLYTLNPFCIPVQYLRLNSKG